MNRARYLQQGENLRWLDSTQKTEINSIAMLMLCPICAGEFQPRLDLCPSCGCGLVPSSLNEDEEEGETKQIELVELCRPTIYPVAMLIKQVLEQNGVTTVIKGGHSLSILPHLVFGGELRILVDNQQLEYARELYQAYFESEASEDDPLL